MVFYNEIDRFASEWLRQLMEHSLIPVGTINTRSIAELVPEDVAGVNHAHFFAGIGGWPYALKLAGWSDDREVWTGSCPCQPFSVAGKRKATDDERHLWPEFLRLIREQRPATIFGEQVASRAGREWLAGVFADLENLGYAVGAADLCAAGVGAPHIRQRLFWVADTNGTGKTMVIQSSDVLCGRKDAVTSFGFGRSGATGGLANAGREGARGNARTGARTKKSSQGPWHSNRHDRGDAFEPCGATSGLADTNGSRLEERSDERRDNGSQLSPVERDGGTTFWSDAVWLPCLDGKARHIESSIHPLAHGFSGRVGRLRGYGNAIVPQVAAAFVRAFLYD